MNYTMLAFAGLDDIGMYLIEENKEHFSLVQAKKFEMRSRHLIPYVPDYLVNTEETVADLQKFFKNNMEKAKRKMNYRVILPDDFTEIESQAMEDIMLQAGAKNCISEYTSFLLSKEKKYIAMTRSKRSVIVSKVDLDIADSDEYFLDIHTVKEADIQAVLHTLDPNNQLPVYYYDMIEELKVGTEVRREDIIDNFLTQI